jgi:hypothetical protein
VITTGLRFAPGNFTRNYPNWKQPSTGIVHAFHSGHWGDWAFQVDSLNVANETLHWSYGGFQEARGRPSGAEWYELPPCVHMESKFRETCRYIENIMEECDSPNEWFWDAATNKLYYYFNGTSPLVTEKAFVGTRLGREASRTADAGGVVRDASGRFVLPVYHEGRLVTRAAASGRAIVLELSEPVAAPPLAATQIDNLFTVAGSQIAPVSDVSFVGLTLTQTSPTFMKPYFVPSGGDWYVTSLFIYWMLVPSFLCRSIHRNAAIYIEGTVNTIVENCLFW